MRNLIVSILSIAFATMASAQNFADKYSRPLASVVKDVEKMFHIKVQCKEVDTTGLVLTYADFRIREYSVEETLRNIFAPFDFEAHWQKAGSWRVRPFEAARRQPTDGINLLKSLSEKYADRETWETRRETLRHEVHARLGIDEMVKQCSSENPELGKIRHHDGYSTQNFRMKMVGKYTLCGTIYWPTGKGRHALIISPAGHFPDARYNADLQKRYATLARMGAITISYDLWGWGQSEDEVGRAAHYTDTAHVMQALSGLRVTDWAIGLKQVDKDRVGVCGGSGGGSHTVLLTILDDRFTAACPVVSVCSWFDGGCPCESGRPIHLAGGRTCNAELMAAFAPRPLRLVSDGGDWTRTTPELEFPFIRRTYAFYGAEGKVSNVHLPSERHDFGPNKRAAVYDFFAQTFGLDTDKIDEEKVTIESADELKFKKIKTIQSQKIILSK